MLERLRWVVLFFIFVLVTGFILSSPVVQACVPPAVCCAFPQAVGWGACGAVSSSCTYSCGGCYTSCRYVRGRLVCANCCSYPNPGNCGGGGGGNGNPTCDLNSVDETITYDARSFFDLTTGVVSTTLPTTRTYRINVRDPNGDSVAVSVSSSKPQCLKAANSGTMLRLIPQGTVTGVDAVPLDTANTCQVKVSVGLDDGNGGTGSCSKTITVKYPAPRLESLTLVDRNADLNLGGPDAVQSSGLADLQFVMVGGWHKDPFRATPAKLKNPASPTRILLPKEQRFNLTSVIASDHNPVTLKFIIEDPNGSASLDFNSWEIALEDTTGYGNFISLRLPDYTLVYNPASRLLKAVRAYGYREDGTVIEYPTQELKSCVEDSNARVCITGRMYLVASAISKAVYEYDIYFKDSATFVGIYKPVLRVKDTEGISIMDKDSTRIIFNAPLTLDIPANTVLDKQGNPWTAGEALIIDPHAPRIVNIEFSAINADTLAMDVEVADDKRGTYIGLPSGIPIFRTYVFAQNSQSGVTEGIENRFLLSEGGLSIDGSDQLGDNLYGWQVIETVSPVHKKYRLILKGVLGGDDLEVGFCVRDRANNVTCTDDVPSELAIGYNWLKTSLGNVYSAGGFNGLPSYNAIVSITEAPEQVRSLVFPFNATVYASLSTFLVVTGEESEVPVKWGYDGHYDIPGFYLSGYKSVRTDGWAGVLVDRAVNVCNTQVGQCVVLEVTDTAELQNALADTHPYKVIRLRNATITLPDSVTFNNNNIVFVENSTVRLYELRKAGGIGSLNDTLLWVAYGGSNILIDDNPNTGYDSITDIVEAGFIVLDTSTFKVVQGFSADSALASRDYYKDGDGNFDRLILIGFVYSHNRPLFERDLGLENNRRYPSEWIMYDPSIILKWEPYLGMYKTQVYRCGYINHPHCNLED